MENKNKILNEIKNGKLKGKTSKEIFALFPYSKAKKQTLSSLKELESENKIVKNLQGKYFVPESLGAFFANVNANERGFAFLTPLKNPESGDFFVPKRYLLDAYDKDEVLAAPTGYGDEAYVIKVIKRGRKNIVGKLKKVGAHGKVLPDDNKLPDVFLNFLPPDVKGGQKVVCEITAYSKRGPNGKIIEVLGDCDDFDAEELSIIRSHGLYEDFPKEVLLEADKAEKKRLKFDNRRDLRDELIFTIDGADTRDIDDGVSIDFKDGKYILGVHIADVSAYVKPRSRLDAEAYARGTSTYFPDRVLPMLPRQLSNGICSLNEGEERAAISCVMTFSKSGKRIDSEIFESVIVSKRKFSYAEVEKVLNGDKHALKKYKNESESLLIMNELQLLLEKEKLKKGEIDLNVKEGKIYLDEYGDIVIPDYKRLESEKIIEQFMIAANEAVAEFLSNHSAPCLYRIHEVPVPEKVENFYEFLKGLGIGKNFKGDEPTPKDYQNILTATKDKPFSDTVNKVMLRSMQKARYAEKNLKHFGLASDCYCHFTSPIRRYPDLFVHRAVKAVIYNDTQTLTALAAQAKSCGDYCSERERVSSEAERDVNALYKLAYMQDKIGERYEATVSGVCDFGIFCELANTVEGILYIDALPIDDYEYYPERFMIKGRKHSYTLGDKINVVVADCDFIKMRVIFDLET